MPDAQGLGLNAKAIFMYRDNEDATRVEVFYRG